jgi:hypothetical protein
MTASPHAPSPAWLPIGTAPRDGTRVLVVDKDPLGGGAEVVIAAYDGEDWHTADGLLCFPIAWMPLPAIPETA